MCDERRRRKKDENEKSATFTDIRKFDFRELKNNFLLNMEVSSNSVFLNLFFSFKSRLRTIFKVSVPVNQELLIFRACFSIQITIVIKELP